MGSWLTSRLLNKGAFIVALIRDGDPHSQLYRSRDIGRVSIVRGDLADYWTLERAINEHEIDTVFHLGAQTIVGTAHRYPLPTFEANIRGTYNLLEACRIHMDMVGRVVIASSDKAYGEQENLPYVESMRLKGLMPYEVSKSCADMLAQSYFHTYDLPVAIVRCGNIYGGGDLNWTRIVPGTIRSILEGKRPVIRSNGHYIRDYIYVEDVVSAYLLIGESLYDQRVQGEPFNISSEQPITVIDLVHKIITLMTDEQLDPIVLDSAKGELIAQYLSSSKAKRLLEWKPVFTLEQGLSETIKWYREFFIR